MLAKLFHGFDEAVGNAVEECFVSKRSCDKSLATSFCYEICMNEELGAEFCESANIVWC